MKAILEFELPEHQEEFKMASRGKDYFCTLHDLKNLLRSRQKYGISIEEFESRFEELIYDVILDDIS